MLEGGDFPRTALPPLPPAQEGSERAPPAETGGGTHLAREPPPVPRRSGSALHTDEAASVSKAQGAAAGDRAATSTRNPQQGLSLRNGVPHLS